MIRIGCAGVGLVLLTSCSAGTTPTVEPTASAPTTSVSTGTDLTIAVSDGKGAPTTVTLSCDPAGGTHPDPTAACAFLAAGAEQGADPFAPVPADRACAEVYGGPDTATVDGVWQGKPVAAEFSRTDACQSARWDQAKILLTVN